MPYPDNFNSAAFDRQFADDDAVTRDDANRWHKSFMARVDGPFKAFLAAVENDYHKHLGEDAPALELRSAAIAEMVHEMIGDDMEWGGFDD